MCDISAHANYNGLNRKKILETLQQKPIDRVSECRLVCIIHVYNYIGRHHSYDKINELHIKICLKTGTVVNKIDFPINNISLVGNVSRRENKTNFGNQLIPLFIIHGALIFFGTQIISLQSILSNALSVRLFQRRQ